MTTLRRWACGAGAAIVLLVPAAPAAVWSGAAFEVVATGVPRPLEVAHDGDSLLVLSPGASGDMAGEIYRVPLDEERPIDLSRQPRLSLPYVDQRLAAFGSLAVHPQTRELYLGEENGTRVYRLGEQGRLSPYAKGLHRLGGGSTIAFDRSGRLVLVDYMDPMLALGEERAYPELEPFRQEAYTGPLVFRLAPDPLIPLPRRLDVAAPLLPRAWKPRPAGAALPHLVSVAPVRSDDLLLLTSSGLIERLAGDGSLALFTRLPPGQYNRTHMVVAPDGTVFVSGGFQVRAVYRVTPDGTVTMVASGLADPEGIALDSKGRLYVAESTFHRILRLRPF
jgi:hypothetical protein